MRSSAMWASKMAGSKGAEAEIKVFKDGSPEYTSVVWQAEQIKPRLLEILYPQRWSGPVDPGQGRHCLLSWQGREWRIEKGSEPRSYIKIEIRGQEMPQEDYQEEDRHMAATYERDPSWLILPCGNCGNCSDCDWADCKDLGL